MDSAKIYCLATPRQGMPSSPAVTWEGKDNDSLLSESLLAGKVPRAHVMSERDITEVKGGRGLQWRSRGAKTFMDRAKASEPSQRCKN